MQDLGPRHLRMAKRQAPPGAPTSQATPPSSTSTDSHSAPSGTPKGPTSAQTTASTSQNCVLPGLLCPTPSSSTSASSAKSTSSTTSHPQTTPSALTNTPPPPPLTDSTSSLASMTTISSSSATATSGSNNDSGPIAGGVIGGLFAVAIIGMFISFLLRQWRRRRIDKAIFDSNDFRRSAVVLDDASAENIGQKQLFNPRPPTMIEKRVAGGQRTFGGGGFPPPPPGYGGYGQPFYPPQPTQRGYYPQQPVHVPGGYNQMYAGGYGPPVAPPSRTQTPLHQQVGQPPRTQTPLHQPDPMSLPNPFGTRSPSTVPPAEGIVGDPMREGRPSDGEMPPMYG